MNKQRPVLKNIIKENTTEIEQFQNKTIRPIIKMQNDLIIAFFSDYLKTRKVQFVELTLEKQNKMINSSLNKDIKLKNILLGFILGNFNREELEVYLLQPSEYNRRIKQILTQRLKDNKSQIQ